MQRTEVREPNRKVTVALDVCAVQQAMTRAVHGLQPHFFLLLALLVPPLDTEHVLCIVLPVTRLLPQRLLVYYGRDNFLEAKLGVLRAQERLQLLKDVGAVGQNERRAGAVGRCNKQIVCRCERAMVEGRSRWCCCRGRSIELWFGRGARHRGLELVRRRTRAAPYRRPGMLPTPELAQRNSQC